MVLKLELYKRQRETTKSIDEHMVFHVQASNLLLLFFEATKNHKILNRSQNRFSENRKRKHTDRACATHISFNTVAILLNATELCLSINNFLCRPKAFL